MTLKQLKIILLMVSVYDSKMHGNAPMRVAPVSMAVLTADDATDSGPSIVPCRIHTCKHTHTQTCTCIVS